MQEHAEKKENPIASKMNHDKSLRRKKNHEEIKEMTGKGRRRTCLQWRIYRHRLCTGGMVELEFLQWLLPALRSGFFCLQGLQCEWGRGLTTDD
jgi:hypothetical protein